jgi:WD40 repeat protein
MNVSQPSALSEKSYPKGDMHANTFCETISRLELQPEEFMESMCGKVRRSMLLASAALLLCPHMLTAQETKPLLTLTGHEKENVGGVKNGIFSLTFSADGKTLVSGDSQGTLCVWDVVTGKNQAKLRHSGLVIGAVFTPDGKSLISSDWSGNVNLWDVANWKPRTTLRKETADDDCHCFAIATDGKTLFFGTSGEKKGHRVQIWDLATGRETSALKGFRGGVGALLCSPDGAILATGSIVAGNDGNAVGGEVNLWKAVTHEHLTTLKGHTKGVDSLAFTADGKTLASGSSDKTVKLWDVATGKELKTLAGHTEFARSVTFAPDGKILVSADWDGIRLWDVSTGQQRLAFGAHGDPVGQVAFSPDGRILVTAGAYDATVKLWDFAKILDSKRGQ